MWKTLCIYNTSGVGIEETRSSDELVLAVISTVVVFLVIVILTLIAGFTCGYYIRGQKCKETFKQISSNPVSMASQPATAAVYEDMDVLPSAVEHQERNLELKQNVAYGPSKSMSVTQQ